LLPETKLEIEMGTAAVRINNQQRRLCVLLLALLAVAFASATRAAQDTSQSAAAPKAAPAVGTIKTIDGTTITLTTDSGAEVKVSVPADAKLVRVPPGSKDLKEAAPISFTDLQVGDRVLVRGKAGDSSGTMVAAAVIAMKKGDIAEKQTHEREEWQRRGIGGLVKSVDTGTGTVTISTVTVAGNKDVTVQVTKPTILRRYAPDSIKFDDAKASTLTEIKPGDQLRARGTRSADGATFSADEIVTGSFRNISGMISAVNPGEGTITLTDLTTKNPVEVKVTADSQLRKLPQPMAQRIAIRLKGGTPDGGASSGGSAVGGNAAGQSATTPQQRTSPGGANASNGGASGGGMGPGGMGGGTRGGGDLQQLLNRLPANTLADFQKGDAVMIVATSGQRESQATAITLLGGVEPILQASPQGTSILTPWSLNTGGGDTGTP
jgi:Cu/Ag efflux protein CusF